MLRKIFTLAAALGLLCLSAQAAGGAFKTELNALTDAQRNNLTLCVSALDSVRLEPNETFSFNALLGERDEAFGFMTAADELGREVIAGGVSQAATAIYGALSESGMNGVTFLSLTTCGDAFAQDYIYSGEKAVYTDELTDFSFINRTGKEMLIGFTMEGDALLCTISLSEPAGWNFTADAENASFEVPFETGTAVTLAETAIDSGADASTLHNVALAAGSISDFTMADGDVFSFNAIVGERSEANGFVPAANGRGVTVVGGGVARTASAVWLCIKDLDDFEILSRSTYGSRYTGSYVKDAADAILTDYTAGIDFSFRYIGTGCVTFYTRLENETLYCSVMRESGS